MPCAYHLIIPYARLACTLASCPSLLIRMIDSCATASAGLQRMRMVITPTPTTRIHDRTAGWLVLYQPSATHQAIRYKSISCWCCLEI